MSSTSKKGADSKIAMLGNAGVGKSALVVRFLTRRFIGEYDPTLECKYKHHTTIDDESVAMEILDTAGQEWTIEREGHARWADGFALVYAANDRQSFEEIFKMKQNLDDIKKSNSTCVLVGNKTDLCHGRKVSYLEGQTLATCMSCAFYETSASDGGEEIYQLFHELHREIKRRKQVETRSRRKSSAHQVKHVFNKMFKSPGTKQ